MWRHTTGAPGAPLVSQNGHANVTFQPFTKGTHRSSPGAVRARAARAPWAPHRRVCRPRAERFQVLSRSGVRDWWCARCAATRHPRAFVLHCRDRPSRCAVPPLIRTASRIIPSAASAASHARTTAGITPVCPTMSGLARLTTPKAKRPVGERSRKIFRNLPCAHLRCEVVRGHIAPRGSEDALLLGPRLLAAAVEEIGHVGVLLGLGDVQLREARRAPATSASTSRDRARRRTRPAPEAHRRSASSWRAVRPFQSARGRTRACGRGGS